MNDDVRSVDVEVDGGQAIDADIDLKVQDVAELFGTTPQTVNRWVRTILAKHKIDLGYFIEGARWLRPNDINILRKFREGALDADEGEEVQDNGDRVTQTADEAYQGFSAVTKRIDDQINRALDLRDNYALDRGRLLGQALNPDSIMADILKVAAQTSSGEGSEDLGELTEGAMVKPFRRTTRNLNLSGSSGERRLKGTRGN